MLIILITQAWYRVFRSPLKEIPGPWLAKITSLYKEYYAARGLLFVYLKKLHDEYGPIVQIGPNLVSVITKESSELIYKTHGFKKGTFYASFGERDEHTSRKRIVRRAFTPQNLKRLESIVQEVAIQPLINQLLVSKTVDFYAIAHLMLFDVIGHLVFSRDFNLVEAGDHPFIHWLSDGQIYSLLRSLFPPIQYMGNIFGKGGYEALNSFCQEMIEARRKEEPKKDILQDFLEATDNNGLPFSNEDIVSEMVMQILAGTDTTANTMTWTLKLLLENPDELEKLVAEIDAAFPSPNSITADAVRDKCPYLDAVLSESMRLYPAGAGHLARIVPQGGAEIEGYHIPAGTECGVSPFAYHRSPELWEDPDTFRPARFLGPNSTQAKSNYLPFLLGPRSCAGREMAWMAMYLTFSYLLRQFQVSWHDPTLPITPIYYLVLRPKESTMLVRVTPRKL